MDSYHGVLSILEEVEVLEEGLWCELLLLDTPDTILTFHENYITTF
jgi:hypothetical protein